MSSKRRKAKAISHRAARAGEPDFRRELEYRAADAAWRESKRACGHRGYLREFVQVGSLERAA